ncbi:MAG TPA: ATPase domain-containing protein [Polyangiaceae bacterium]|nr:ATPase domain-containing protein [Polyangiaceae bacterium]
MSTGISGLDDVLGGGLPERRLYLVKGAPGVGKTTLALQFLTAGARLGESVLYITLSETESEIRQVAESHGWSLEGIRLFELSSADQTLRLFDENTLYAAEDVDLREIVQVLLELVQKLNPKRVVFDSLSEIRLLSQTPVRYRRQLLALKHFFGERDCTTLLLDEAPDDDGSDLQIESLAHGVILLEQLPVQYGADRRRLRIKKLRGTRFRSGFHDFTVATGGLSVFPRLVAAEHRTDLLAEPISTGIYGLDSVLGGGLDRATCTLILGPAGAGKSAIATQMAVASAQRGEAASVFLFEERIGTWLRRARQLGMGVDEQVAKGKLHVHQVDPAEMAPDEFTHLVRSAVERDGCRQVLIDSITGYFTAMPEARFLTLQMHELLSYLSERGVASVITMAQSGMIGSQMRSPVDVSYLADTVMVLRYFELEGRLRQALSVLKKRSGAHENTIRDVRFDQRGIHVGETLSELRGVLVGLPHLLGSSQEQEVPSRDFR